MVAEMELSVRRARWRYWLLLAVVLGFTAIGVLALAVEQTLAGRSIGGVLILFFGTAAVVFARELLDARPRIRIDEYGVEDRTLGVGTIPWSEIAFAYRREVQGHAFICLVLRDAQQWGGRTEFNLNLSGVNAGAERLYQLVLRLSMAAAKTGS
jgi:hypothetical protein